MYYLILPITNIPAPSYAPENISYLKGEEGGGGEEDSQLLEIELAQGKT